VAGGGVEAHHIGAELGELEPQRHLPAQDAAALVVEMAAARMFAARTGVALAPLAGDHQHEAGAARLRGRHEVAQRRVRLRLGHAVQVEAGIDLGVAAGQPLGVAAAERRVAMQWAAQANEAFRTLRSPVARAAYLCERNGQPIGAESNTAMPASQ